MKTSVELEVALLGLRGTRTQVNPSVDVWVDEALACNYWRHLCERVEPTRARRAPPMRRAIAQDVVENAA